MSTSGYEHIIRIVGKDIAGDKKLLVGLQQIKGVGRAFANAILDKLEMNTDANIGNMTEKQVEDIEVVLKDPIKAGFPLWFLNRQQDLETGNDLHLITSDVPFTIRNDVEREKLIGSWRGYRHMFGLKVRGQRTRTTGRKGGAVGVAKGGKIMPARTGDAPTDGAAATASADGTAKAGDAPATGSTKAPPPATGSTKAPPPAAKPEEKKKG